MKKSTICILFSFILLSTIKVFSQDDQPKELLSLSAGAGVLTFNGTIGKGKDVSSYTYIRGGYAFNVEKRFMNDWIGVSANVMTGKLAMGERSTDTAYNKNFESSMMQFGLNLTFYLQNKKDVPLIPYFTTGFSYAMLSAKTDIKFGDSLYYYWNDGSIRNLPQIPGNEIIAHHVNRDYTYETALTGAATSAMAIPIGLGMKMKIGKKVEANIGATYHLTLAKNIDGIQGSTNNKYLYSYFSITYNIFVKSKAQKDQERKGPKIDFSSMDKLDSDHDGVKDADDECPGTPKGVKVDSKGCPLDSDGDGIPDYLDKEKDTKKGAVVDAEGRTLTDAMILAKAKQDSLISYRTATFGNDPSASSLKKLDTQIQKKEQSGQSSTKIPTEFLSADANKDGIISSTEITAVIDGFFDGSNDYTVEKIHRLIDFFFEQ